MVEKISQIMRLFEENEQAKEALKSAATKEDAVVILAQYGVEITVEEFTQIGKEITSDELSEEMLMLVSGGGVLKNAWNAVKDFFHGFLDAF